MADDIGKPGQDPRDVATARREQGMIRRAQQRALEEAGRRVAVTSAGGSGAGGGGGGGRALVPSGGDRLPAPSGGGGRDLIPYEQRGSSSTREGSRNAVTRDNRIPLNLGSIPSAARNVAGSVAGRLGAGAFNAIPSVTTAARSSLTSNPEGAEEVRRMAEDARTRADEESREAEANAARAALAERTEARRAAANRSTVRMRPTEMTADDLNNLSLTRGVVSDFNVDTQAGKNIRRRLAEMEPGMKKGGPVKKMAKGGPVKASKKDMKPVYKMAKGGAARGDGCAARGKTKGRMI